MEKSDMIKSIIQYLNEKGFKEVGTKLEEESKISLESKQLKILKSLIKNDKFDESVDLFLKNSDEKDQMYIIPKIRILQIFHTINTNFDENKDKNILNQNESLALIRKICNSSNIYEKDSTIEKCAQLIFIQNKKELLEKMKELCYFASSKERFFEYLETTLSNSKSLLKTMHPKSLENMMDCVFKRQINNCIYHLEEGNSNEEVDTKKYNPGINSGNAFKKYFSYFEDHQCLKENLPHKVILSIERHDEEITGLILSPSQNFFAVILKSNFVVIYKFFKKKEKSKKSELFIQHISNIKAHENQITSLVWSSNEINILTASKDKFVKVFDANTGECKIKINLNTMASSAIYLDNEQRILTSSLDQKLNLWDLQGNLIESITTVTVDQILFSKKLNMVVLVAPTNKSILLYDYSLRNEIDKLNVNDTIVSSSLSKLDDGEYLLVNSSTSTPVLSSWHLPTRSIKRKYFGHRQERLTTKCGFGGVKERFILSGSDGKEIYIWNRNNSVPILVIKEHNGIVNSVIWPTNENIIISGSDDHTIKILANEKISKAHYIGSDAMSILNQKNLNLISAELKLMEGLCNNLNNENNNINDNSNNEESSMEMFEEYSEDN